MMRLTSIFLTALLLLQTTPVAVTGQIAAGKDLHLSETTTTPLTNQDVLVLTKAKLSPEVIIAKIKSSPCAFAVSPAELEQLKTAGVKDVVITAMVESVRPFKTVGPESSELQRIESLQIPDGTSIEIEAPYRINSKEFKPNDEISFRVINPIKINGVTMIEQGANATGRIEKAKRGGHFGKAGLLVWSMQSVTAVDGSQVPLRAVRERLRGDSKAAKVATQMVVTGALLLFIAPVALLHGFKRGKDAFIPAGKRYEVFVNGQTAVKVK
ncbi:MAG: hypothetical protein ABR568_08830 [Pyrinomonadaceae bacterium]